MALLPKDWLQKTKKEFSLPNVLQQRSQWFFSPKGTVAKNKYDYLLLIFSSNEWFADFEPPKLFSKVRLKVNWCSNDLMGT